MPPDPRVLRFTRLLRDVKNASGVLARGKALVALVNEVFGQGGTLLLQAFKSSMSWFDWVKTGVEIVLAIGAFTASSMTWFVLQLVSKIYATIAFTYALAQVLTTCF